MEPRAARRSLAGATRRRSALLRLAERHGEVRVALTDARGARPGAAEVVELLDELNERGRLRYGGLRRTGGGSELFYLAA